MTSQWSPRKLLFWWLHNCRHIGHGVFVILNNLPVSIVNIIDKQEYKSSPEYELDWCMIKSAEKPFGLQRFDHVTKSSSFFGEPLNLLFFLKYNLLLLSWQRLSWFPDSGVINFTNLVEASFITICPISLSPANQIIRNKGNWGPGVMRFIR